MRARNARETGGFITYLVQVLPDPTDRTLTPASSIPLPSFGETFIHQCLAEAIAAARDDSKLLPLLRRFPSAILIVRATGHLESDEPQMEHKFNGYAVGTPQSDRRRKLLRKEDRL